MNLEVDPSNVCVAIATSFEIIDLRPGCSRSPGSRTSNRLSMTWAGVRAELLSMNQEQSKISRTIVHDMSQAYRQTDRGKDQYLCCVFSHSEPDLNNDSLRRGRYFQSHGIWPHKQVPIRCLRTGKHHKSIVAIIWAIVAFAKARHIAAKTSYHVLCPRRSSL